MIPLFGNYVGKSGAHWQLPLVKLITWPIWQSNHHPQEATHGNSSQKLNDISLSSILSRVKNRCSLGLWNYRRDGSLSKPTTPPRYQRNPTRKPTWKNDGNQLEDHPFRPFAELSHKLGSCHSLASWRPWKFTGFVRIQNGWSFPRKKKKNNNCQNKHHNHPGDYWRW